MVSDGDKTFEGWAILEVMGHRRLGGFVTEQEIAGAGFLRIDVPGEEGGPVATQFYPPSSVYCLTPVAEAMARAVALRNQPEPVSRWELPAPKQQPSADHLQGEPYYDSLRHGAAALEDEDQDDDDRDDVPFS